MKRFKTNNPRFIETDSIDGFIFKPKPQDQDYQPVKRGHTKTIAGENSTSKFLAICRKNFN